LIDAPAEHRGHRRAGLRNGYDADGNRTSASGPAGSQSFAFDSNNRITCASASTQSSLPPCSQSQFLYDVDGALIYGLEAYEADELVSWQANTATLRIWAFGEEFARKNLSGHQPRTASLWGAPLGFPGPWGPALLVVLAGAGVVPLAFRVRRIEWKWEPKTAREIASAALASGLVLVLIFPPLPILAGGIPPGQVRVWLLSDPLGSSTALLLDDGTVGSETVFAPFGGVYDSQAASGSGSVRFAGHRQAAPAAGGIHYMKARWQDPVTGPFLSVDPVVADAADPQSYNGYAYARNNPVNVTDPTGMCGMGPLGIASWGCMPADIPMFQSGYFNASTAFSAADNARQAAWEVETSAWMRESKLATGEKSWWDDGGSQSQIGGVQYADAGNVDRRRDRSEW
jgi:RHS repeat-associated protein